jgi:hypothetical protein
VNGFVDEGVDYEVAHPRPSGYTAGSAGLPLSACPWKPGTAEARRWTTAWIDATYDRRAEAGDVGATADDKTAAGLLPVETEKGLGYCDPRVHEMWRPNLGGFAGVSFTAPATGSYDLRLNLDPLLSSMTVTVPPEYVERLMQALGLAIDQAADILRSVMPIVDAYMADPEPTDPKARALARKRRPFVCHRHGQQPGGFCRTCQRGAR